MNGQAIDIVIRAKDEATKVLKKTQSTAVSMGWALKEAAKIWAVAFAALSGVIYAGKQAIDEDAQATFRLTKLLKTASKATDDQVASLVAQAEALEKTTVAGYDMIATTQSQLATFSLQTSTIEKLTPAILDYVVAEKGATASADDYRTMTNGLAQALNGNFASLTKAGFILDEHTKSIIKNGTESEKADAIQRILAGTYWGFATEAMDTAIGRQIMLNKTLEDLSKEVAIFAIPIIDAFKGKILEIARAVLVWVQDNKVAISGYISYFAEKIKELKDTIIPIVVETYTKIKDVTLETIAYLKQYWDEYWNEIRLVLDVIKNIFLIAFFAIKLIIESVMNIIGPLVKNTMTIIWESIRLVASILTLDFGGAWESLKAIFVAVMDIMANIIMEFLNLVSKVFGTDIVAVIDGTMAYLEDKAAKAKALLASIRDSYLNSGYGQAMGNIGASVYDTVHGSNATGGSQFSNKPYLVGERGAEVVIPKSASTVIPASELKWGGPSISINFGGVSVRNDSDIRAIASAVEDSITRKMQLYRQGIA